MVHPSYPCARILGIWTLKAKKGKKKSKLCSNALLWEGGFTSEHDAVPRFLPDQPQTRFSGSKLFEDCDIVALNGAPLPTLCTSKNVGPLIAIPHVTYWYDLPDCIECGRMYKRGGESEESFVKKFVPLKIYNRIDHFLLESLKMEVCELVHVLIEQGSNTCPREDESTRVQQQLAFTHVQCAMCVIWTLRTLTCGTNPHMEESHCALHWHMPSQI